MNLRKDHYRKRAHGEPPGNRVPEAVQAVVSGCLGSPGTRGARSRPPTPRPLRRLGLSGRGGRPRPSSSTPTPGGRLRPGAPPSGPVALARPAGGKARACDTQNTQPLPGPRLLPGALRPRAYPSAPTVRPCGLLRGLDGLDAGAPAEGGGGPCPVELRTWPETSRTLKTARAAACLALACPPVRLRVPNSLSLLRGEAGGSMSPPPLCCPPSAGT